MIFPAYAAENLKEKKTVRVAFPKQSGMSEIGESGDLAGYNYLYLQNLSEYAGWNIEYVTYSDLPVDEGIMQAMQDVTVGKVDLLGPMLKTPSVEEMFAFPKNNYGVVYTTLSSSENSNLTAVNFTRCDPLRVAVYASATTRNEEVKAYLEQLNMDYQLIPCKTTGEQMEKLESGEADVLSSITLSYFEGTRSVAQFAPRPYYFVTSKENTDLLEELDQAAEKLNYTQPKLQERLQDKFFGDTSGGFVLTDAENEYLANLQSIDVLCISNYAPYCIRLKDGRPSGLLVSLLNDFAEYNGVEINYEFCNDAAALENAWESGKYDCVIGLPFTPAYCIKYGIIRSSSVITTNMEIYGETQKKDYSESSVAVYGDFTDQMNLDAFARVIPYPSLDECFKAVLNKEADYGCTNQLSADYEIFANSYPFITTPLLGEDLGIGVAVDAEMDSRFLSALNKYIDTLPDNTITAYLSVASRHEDIDPFVLFVRKQPIVVAAVLTVAAVLVILMVTVLVISGKRKKWNLELRAANEEIQRATAAKSQFLSQMSHDIRTPMNAILGFARLGKEDLDSPELLKSDLEKITSSGEFLLGLVNDILDMTKIESHAMKLKLQPYTLKEFEKQLTTLLEPLCFNKKLDYRLEFAKDMPACIRVDQLRYNQIFFNLLSNAVKFTPEGGTIRITGTCRGNDGKNAHMTYTVQDNGIGMSEEFQKRMFDSFAQEERHISTQQGTGLGLSIVKSLVGLMNGTIRVESKVGEGSCFILDMTAEICEVPEEDLSEKKHTYSHVLAGEKVLLCEDHPLNTKLACRILEKVGVIVECAANGAEGVKRFEASKPGDFKMILMDIQMPVMNGIDATRAIRDLDRPDARTIPIIAMTANAFADDVQKCLDAGMNAHLAKPIDPNQVYETMANFAG